MNLKNRVIFYALIAGLILYFVDALIYYLIFTEDSSFLQTLITAVPLAEIYNRLLMFAGVLVFGFIVSGFVSDLILENEFLKIQPGNNPQGKLDSSFMSSLSYQIRTPLNAIVGFSELLKDPNLSPQSKQTYINHIHSSGNYLLQLINNVVDISKIESDQLSINKSEFKVKEVLEDLQKHFEERKKELGRSNVAFVIKKSDQDKDFSIITDKERFKQVLENLLENAFKQTEEGMVELGYRVKEDNLLEFYIKDTGQGYSMDRLEIIFNRYKKLSDNHNQPFDGLALKLTISKNLVKLLGGSIWADSKPGQGATFYFTLPFKEAEASTEQDKETFSPPVEKKGVKDWKNKTILIAEDVESNFIYLQELLKPTGVNLIWAQDGAKAVEKLKTNKEIDLVLMDILMPEMDGYEAARKAKQMRPEIPVIAQTAYSLEGDRDKSDLKNFDDYLIKPIWSPQLMAAIEKHFKG